MKRLIEGLLVAFGVLAACAGSAQVQQAWVAKYDNNGITNGNHQALKMALDSAGSIYVMGVSANANTNTGYVVVKYAPNGNQIWAARYDSTSYPTANPTGFALDSSNAVVITGNALTVKFNADGNLLWTAPYSAQAITVDSGQNIYITGISNGFTTMRLAPSGNNMWSDTWVYQGGPNLSQAIVVDSASNVYVAGLETFYNGPQVAHQTEGLLEYDVNGNQLWSSAVPESPVGDPVVVGFSVDGSGDVYMEFNYLGGFGGVSGYQTSRFNSDGSNVWDNYNPTGNGASFASGLALDSATNILITGQNAHYPPPSTYGTYKLDTNGNYLWANLYPMSSSGGSAALALGLDSVDNVYVTGESSITNTPYDIATLKLDSNGNQLWVHRYSSPGPGNAAGNAIAVDNSGNVYVAGYETETTGFTSMILIKYASAPTIQKQSNGNFILDAYGLPGQTFDIQASTDLQSWVDLGDIIAGTNGVAQFEDTNAALFGSRFYYAAPK
jgi:hypothetical protein